MLQSISLKFFEIFGTRSCVMMCGRISFFRMYYSAMYGFRVAMISSRPLSAWMLSSIGFEISRLKIPMMDFASIT